MPHDPIVTLFDALVAARHAVYKLDGMSLDDFMDDSDVQWIAWSQLVLLGESFSRLPAEFRSAHPEAPWRVVIATRNRILHGYDSIDWELIYAIVHREVRALIPILEALVTP